MASTGKGVVVAAVQFFCVGILVPLAAYYLSPRVSAYVKLPPEMELVEVFLFFGALLAVTSFCLNAYPKGRYPWLFGKIGGGVVDILLFYYIFLLLPGSITSLGSMGIESSGLIYLVVLAMALSYVSVLFDFFDARHKVKGPPVITLR